MIAVTEVDLEQMFKVAAPKERYDDEEEVLWRDTNGKMLPANVLTSFLNGPAGWTYRLQLKTPRGGSSVVGNISHGSLRPFLQVAALPH